MLHIADLIQKYVAEAIKQQKVKTVEIEAMQISLRISRRNETIKETVIHDVEKKQQI